MKKALQAIEEITSSDFVHDMEMLLYRVEKKEACCDENHIKCIEMISTVYKISHSEGNCKHPEWKKIKDEILKT